MVASAALSFAVDDWKPYKSYQELSRQKRGGSGLKSIKPSKELVAMEIKRRNSQHKTNTKNKTISQLMDELENTLTDQRDVYCSTIPKSTVRSYRNIHHTFKHAAIDH
jgi:hypothetical protein